MATQQRIRLRMFVGGQFVQTINPEGILQWRYSGGEIFNESLELDCSYIDLTMRINEKLSCTTSIKYLAPGEDLSPDELISVGGEDDWNELKEEYLNALLHPEAQSDRTFRVKLFLFSALQDEIELDILGPELIMADNFDPSEWCGDDDEDENTTSPSATNEGSKSREGMQWDQPRLPSLKSLVANEPELDYQADYQHQYQYQYHDKRSDSLPPDFIPAFVDRPSHEKRQKGLFGGIATSNRGRVGEEAPFAPNHPNHQMTEEMDLLDPYHDDKLDRHAMDNLLQSVLSKSTFSPQQPVERRRRPFALNPRITEEMDLLDPYHEDDSSIKTGGFLQGLGFMMDVEKKQSRLKQAAPPPIVLNSPQPNAYSSLAGNFPSHISIFGGAEDNTGGPRNGDGGNGMTRQKGARALSGGADGGSSDDTVGHQGPEAGSHAHTSPRSNASHGPQKWQIVAKPPFEANVDEIVRSVHLPSHISIFGEVEGEAMVEEAGPASNLIVTQEFNMAAGKNQPAADVGVDGGDDPEAGQGGKRGLEGTGQGDGEEAAFQLSTPKVLEEVMQVCIDEVQIIRKIGEGAFGEVSFANIQSHGNVAIKWLKKDRFSKHSESFMREAAVLAKLNHPNIIRMYGVIVEPIITSPSMSRMSSGSSSKDGGIDFGARPPHSSTQLPQTALIAGIMTDFVRGGSLKDQLRHATRCLTLKERCQVAVQAARGMAYLHAQNPAVIHFDLKPDNLLVDGDGDTLHVKVADFGLSKHKFSSFVSCRELRGTLPYMAPELVSNPLEVSERCDVWSMGVVMWEMYTRESPYSNMTAQQIISALMHGNIALRLPNACEPEWRGLVEHCMDINPEARPSFKALMSALMAILARL